MTVAQKKAYRRMKLNVVAVLVIVAVALAAATAANALGSAVDARTAVIQDADGNTFTMPLSQDDALTVTSSAGTNVIEVQAGKVRVSEADCPNQDCVEQGWISKAGQQIVCLPHKLVVNITDEDAGSTYDVVGQ
ncbi:NusG domain II-containing protein [uncultured Senegalimassilia sp.]|uniref:NusG domain II-containing protein n=1 Tax=uncultured Senegalimassilia sp. TaxID=1714350 RepID=UPI0025DE67E8|nr:NusG domain II-containing protein [uncultured Senegalimassilia sp.]